MKKIISALLLCFLLQRTASAHTEARIHRIIDADSLVVYSHGKKQYLRLVCVDAVERKQKLGSESTDYLRELLPVGSQIVFEYRDRSWERIVAKIITPDGQSLGALLLARGYGVIDERYIDDCWDELPQLQQQQLLAQEAKVGIWAASDPVFPWQFRSRRKRGLVEQKPLE